MATITSVVTNGFSISGGYTGVVGDIVTSGYSIESGEISITDADALKIANYVWKHILEDSLKAREMMRVIMAAASGVATGLDANSPKYKSVDGTRTRIDAKSDKFGNRSSINLDVDD